MLKPQHHNGSGFCYRIYPQTHHPYAVTFLEHMQVAAQVGLFVEEAEAGDQILTEFSHVSIVQVCWVDFPWLSFVSIASSDRDLWKASAARACLSGSQLLRGFFFGDGRIAAIPSFSHAMCRAFLACTVRPWVLHSGAKGATRVAEEQYVVRPLQ